MTEPSKTPRTDAVMAEVPAYWNNGWMAPLAALCHELETALAESQSEREEQARILGMSGEREARLMAQLSESRSEAASLREKLMEALGAAEGFRDARDAAQDRLRATTGRADLAEARCAALSVDVEAAEARMADYVRYAEATTKAARTVMPALARAAERDATYQPAYEVLSAALSQADDGPGTPNPNFHEIVTVSPAVAQKETDPAPGSGSPLKSAIGASGGGREDGDSPAAETENEKSQLQTNTPSERENAEVCGLPQAQDRSPGNGLDEGSKQLQTGVTAGETALPSSAALSARAYINDVVGGLANVIKACVSQNGPGIGNVPTFEEAWAKKEAEGYHYGHDALEQVRFGWEIRDSYAVPSLGQTDHAQQLYKAVRDILAEDCTDDPGTWTARVTVRRERFRGALRLGGGSRALCGPDGQGCWYPRS